MTRTLRSSRFTVSGVGARPRRSGQSLEHAHRARHQISSPSYLPDLYHAFCWQERISTRDTCPPGIASEAAQAAAESSKRGARGDCGEGFFAARACRRCFTGGRTKKRQHRNDLVRSLRSGSLFSRAQTRTAEGAGGHPQHIFSAAAPQAGQRLRWGFHRETVFARPAR